MSDETFVLVITGPSGSGKSTVGEKLAKQVDRCVNIDADHVKHMIVSGFYKDKNNPAGWGFNQWGLVGDSIGLLALNFLKEGYKIIINGYLDEPAWTNLQKHITFTHKVLLLPLVDTVVKRDEGRNEDFRMGEEAVKEHHRHFLDDGFFQNFTKLDTTSHTTEETVNEILKVLNIKA